MIRRLLRNKKDRRQTPSRPSPSRSRVRRPALALESLEPRRLLALLTNGTGDGQIMVEVNEQGAFGSSPTLAVNIPNNPINNRVTNAIFNPQGPRPALGTTYESGLAIELIVPGATREFLTAGTIGGTGNNVNGTFTTGVNNNLERNSRFFFPNNVPRPTAGQIPANAQLMFDLRQTMVDLQFMGNQDGTALVQQYTITNVSGQDISFALTRYWDGDIFATGTPLLDEAGERLSLPLDNVNGVFQSDVADNCALNDPTFIEIQSSIVGVPTLNRWEVGLAGNALPTKPIGPLLTRIVAGTALANDIVPAAADADNNNIVNAGQDNDWSVALRQEFLNVPNNEVRIFTSTTVFGHPTRGTCPGTGQPPVAQTGFAEGFKFIDRNANGVRDPGETGVRGFTIYADLNQNGVRDPNEPSTLTDQTGFYSLAIPVGMTQIREVVPPNWTQTAPLTGFHLANVMAVGNVVAGLDFGNIPDPGEIRGIKFEDDNRNGVQDANERGMANVTIFLDANDNGVLDVTEQRTVTDAGGNYAFTNLEPGLFVVREIVPDGFDQTTPGGDGAYRINLTPGQVVGSANFGNRLRRGSITGVKWNDLNGDGVRNPGEPPVAGVVIYIDENRDGRFNLGERASITNTFGQYEIADLLPGEYVVREVEQGGVAPTFPAAGFHRVLVFAGLPTPFVDFGNRVNFDFGDAPDSYGTLLASNGARHAIVPGFRLGQRIDGEPNGQPTPDATGDDVNGGGFGAPVSFAVGDQPSGLIYVDVSGDGIPDLVTANRAGGNVSVARGFGDGTFAPPVNFATEPGPVAVFPVDLDGVNGLDLVVAHAADTDVAVLLNNGAGGFAPRVTFAAGGFQSDVATLDVNGDGKLDILVTRPTTNDLAVLLNTSNPGLAFATPAAASNPTTIFPVQTNPVKLKLGRINSDALLDAVVVNQGSNSVSVLRNLGPGGLATAVNYAVGAGPNDVVIADLDADSDRDLAVANATAGTVTVLYNNGLGVFPNLTRATFTVPGGPVGIASGSFDGKPGVDLAVALQASNSVAVLSNDGTGRFPASSVYPTGAGPAAILGVNLDGDNITDILTANFTADTVSALTFEGGDEDGVKFAAPFAPGRTTTVTVNASAAGVVNAWIDFNRSGAFDAGERVLADAAVSAGNNTFFVTTPAGVADGTLIARFRLSAERGLAPIGPANSGEVEDYQITVDSTGGGVPNTGHTNLANPEDVDANGRVELFDVLILVNDLRANGSRVLPPVVNPPPPPPFLDVNGNGSVELNDVLRVVRRILLQRPVAEPEAEGEAEEPHDPFESALDAIATDVCSASTLP